MLPPYFSVTTTVMWLVRLLIGEAEPFARGRKRFIVGPSFANASDTTKFAFSKPKLFSAFATAEFNTFKMISAASLKESHPHDIHITKEAPNYTTEV